MRIAFLAAILGCFLLPAKAQHDHAAGHNDYHGWSSQITPNCCNNHDCRGLEAKETRETATGTEISIDGQWCPILPEHRLVRGRSPDWSVNHACIMPHGHGCTRLLCYTPAGGF
jgi:hypothetical protein